MELVNAKDEILLSICVGPPGRFELDLHSGEPNTNCAFSSLGQQGYSSASLASDGEADLISLDFLCGLVYPYREIVNKMLPDCLKLSPIVQKCKFKVPRTPPQRH